MADVSEREWGLCILDEVHVAPADTFLTCMTTRTRTRARSTSPQRLSKGGIDVPMRISPTLRGQLRDLQNRGFVATVSCAEVEPTSPSP